MVGERSCPLWRRNKGGNGRKTVESLVRYRIKHKGDFILADRAMVVGRKLPRLPYITCSRVNPKVFAQGRTPLSGSPLRVPSAWTLYGYGCVI